MYQKVTVIGYLGGDPELRYTPNGKPVTNFSVATSRKWTGADGEQREDTTWFKVAAWGKLAEVCNQYLAKGRQVLVEGTVKAEAWVGRDGEARASLVLTASTVKFLDGRGEASAPAEEPAPTGFDDEIPF